MSKEMTLDDYNNMIHAIAELAHNLNVTYSTLILGIPVSDAVFWAAQSIDQKRSICFGVEHVLKNPDSTSEQQHDQWCSYKTATGWVYGEVKDEQAKTHPNLRPYNELPERERVKDVLFRTAVLEAQKLYGLAQKNLVHAHPANVLVPVPVDSSSVTIAVLGAAGTGKSLIEHQIGNMLETTFGIPARNITTDAYNERTRVETESVNLARTGLHNLTISIVEIQTPCSGV